MAVLSASMMGRTFWATNARPALVSEMIVVRPGPALFSITPCAHSRLMEELMVCLPIQQRSHRSFCEQPSPYTSSAYRISKALSESPARAAARANRLSMSLLRLLRSLWCSPSLIMVAPALLGLAGCLGMISYLIVRYHTKRTFFVKSPAPKSFYN